MGTAALCEQAMTLLRQSHFPEALREVEKASESVNNKDEGAVALVRETYSKVGRAILEQESHNERARYVDSHGKLTAGVITLLGRFYSEQDTLSQVAEKMKIAWKEADNHKPVSSKSEDDLRRAFETFTAMGLMAPRAASLGWYDYCLIKLEKPADIARAFAGMKNRWNDDGIQFGSIVFLMNQDLEAQVKTQLGLVKEQQDYSEELRSIIERAVYVRADHINKTYQKWMTDVKPKAGTVLSLTHEPALKTLDYIFTSSQLGKEMCLDTMTTSKAAISYDKQVAIQMHLVVLRSFEIISKQNFVPEPLPADQPPAHQNGQVEKPVMPPESPLKKTFNNVVSNRSFFTGPRIFWSTVVGLGLASIIWRFLPRAPKTES